MRETHARPALASYRDTTTGLMQAGEPLVHVDDVIEESGDLALEAKAAFCRLAFSMRSPGDWSRDACAHVAALG